MPTDNEKETVKETADQKHARELAGRTASSGAHAAELAKEETKDREKLLAGDSKESEDSDAAKKKSGVGLDTTAEAEKTRVEELEAAETKKEEKK